MKQGFEDRFMDIQSDYISLCLEYAGSGIDKVFACIYQDEALRMFDAFFEKDHQLIFAGRLQTDVDPEEFFRVGIGDIERLLGTCAEYGHPCPHEMKMVYDVRTRKYDAHFSYEKTPDNDPRARFLSWLQEEEKTLADGAGRQS